MPPLRSLQLVDFLDGTMEEPPKPLMIEEEDKDGKKMPRIIINEEYTKWISQDQQILGFLLSSLSREVLTQVAS